MDILKTRVLTETPFLNLKETDYNDTNGELKHWVWAQRPNNTRAVVIVALVKGVEKVIIRNGSQSLRHEDCLAIIDEYRVPLGMSEVGFPAGLVQDGETPVDAATRELKEETGLVVKEVLEVSPYIYNSAGMTDEAISMVYVEAEGTLTDENTEASEDIRPMLLSAKEISELLQNNDNLKAFGAKAWIVMNQFARTGRIFE